MASQSETSPSQPLAVHVLNACHEKLEGGFAKPYTNLFLHFSFPINTPFFLAKNYYVFVDFAWQLRQLTSIIRMVNIFCWRTLLRANKLGHVHTLCFGIGRTEPPHRLSVESLRLKSFFWATNTPTQRCLMCTCNVAMPHFVCWGLHSRLRHSLINVW